MDWTGRRELCDVFVAVDGCDLGVGQALEQFSDVGVRRVTLVDRSGVGALLRQ